MNVKLLMNPRNLSRKQIVVRLVIVAAYFFVISPIVEAMLDRRLADNMREALIAAQQDEVDAQDRTLRSVSGYGV